MRWNSFNDPLYFVVCIPDTSEHHYDVPHLHLQQQQKQSAGTAAFSSVVTAKAAVTGLTTSPSSTEDNCNSFRLLGRSTLDKTSVTTALKSHICFLIFVSPGKNLNTEFRRDLYLESKYPMSQVGQNSHKRSIGKLEEFVKSALKFFHELSETKLEKFELHILLTHRYLLFFH
jgi:hypothetical protein